MVNKAEGKGVCRRYPPTPVSINREIVFSHFPTMRMDGWCGEFQRPKATMQ